MTTPSPPAATTLFCVCGRTVDVVTDEKFQLYGFKGFGAPKGRKWPSSIDFEHRPYNIKCKHWRATLREDVIERPAEALSIEQIGDRVAHAGGDSIGRQ